MVSAKKDPVLVVLQLSGGNDMLNSLVPYTNPLYFDNRPNVRIPEDQVHGMAACNEVAAGPG